MEMAQTICGGVGGVVELHPLPAACSHEGGACSAPFPGLSGMRPAFFWAVALHVVALLAMAGALRFWPSPLVRFVPPRFELDVMATPPATPVQAVEAPAWAQAVAAVTPELRAPPALPVPPPDVSPVPGTDPVPVPVGGAVNRPEAPDAAREDVRALAALPLWPPAQPTVVSNNAQYPRVAGSGDDAGQPLALAEIRPHYPYAARTRGEEGKVTVHLRVTSGGAVDSVELGRSSGSVLLDQSALATARKARFKPAERNGLPVAADLDLQFDFRLED